MVDEQKVDEQVQDEEILAQDANSNTAADDISLMISEYCRRTFIEKDITISLGKVFMQTHQGITNTGIGIFTNQTNTGKGSFLLCVCCAHRQQAFYKMNGFEL